MRQHWGCGYPQTPQANYTVVGARYVGRVCQGPNGGPQSHPKVSGSRRQTLSCYIRFFSPGEIRPRPVGCHHDCSPSRVGGGVRLPSPPLILGGARGGLFLGCSSRAACGSGAVVVDGAHRAAWPHCGRAACRHRAHFGEAASRQAARPRGHSATTLHGAVCALPQGAGCPLHPRPGVRHPRTRRNFIHSSS